MGIAPEYHEQAKAQGLVLSSQRRSSRFTEAGSGLRAKRERDRHFSSLCRRDNVITLPAPRPHLLHIIAFEGEPIEKMYIGNWSDYEEMMMEKFGKDLQPHRVKYRQLKR